MRRTLLRLLPVMLASTLAAACGDAPTEAATGPTAELGFSLNLSGTEVRSVVVEVSAPDIRVPLVYNIEVVNGTAGGRIDVPAGPSRTIQVRAYDMQHAQTHEGSATTDVRPGSNPPVTVTLRPAPGHVPLSVDFGSLVVSVRAVDGPNAPTGEYTTGTVARFEATVTTADGTPVDGAVVRWASLNPGVASVSSDGMVTALYEGTTEIAATYNGHGASVTVAVTPKTDFDAPTLTAIAFDSAAMHPQHGWGRTTLLRVSVQDVGSGVDSVYAEIRGVSATAYGINCTYMTSTAPGVYTCPFSVSTQTYPADDYVVTSLQIWDNSGNRRTYTRAEMAALGFAPRVSVIHS